MYTRVNKSVFFVLPTMAVGVDEFGYFFIEVAWFNVSIGFGNVD